MKYAIISDIHGNDYALKKVLEDIESRNIQKIINLGDSVSGPFNPQNVISLLQNKEIICVKGNHERQLLGEFKNMGKTDQYSYKLLTKDQLKGLDSWKSYFSDGEILCFHGTPYIDNKYLIYTVTKNGVRDATDDEIINRLGEYYNQYNVFICGHTHIPKIRKIAGNKQIIDVGSVGLPAYRDNVPFEHKMESKSNCARYTIIEKNNESWITNQIKVKYNYQRAAKEAKNRGRSDFANSILSGKVL